MWNWVRTAGRVLAAALVATAAASGQSAKTKPGEADRFFRSGDVPRLVLELDEAACEALRAEPRKFAPGALRENDRTRYEGVSLKLKGAAGSFREFDDWPSFTIRMDKVDKEQNFHGLRKFHLNKSPQDGTYLHELLGSEIFQAAGILTPRVAHARVWVNERDMGLYVVKEGFDELLVQRGFDPSSGNLYDGGFCQDVDASLERDEGSGPVNYADLNALVEACREPDLVRRWARIGELVDVDEFLTFMAVEQMLGHWDGYCSNTNNYRLYFHPADGRAHFLPHGMDQLFGDPEASILDHPPALVAGAIMKNPAWRAAYRKRVGELLPLFDAGKLEKRIDPVAKRLQAALKDFDEAAADAHKAAVSDLKNRLNARERSLKDQKGQPEPKPLVFQVGQPERLQKWRANSECEDAALTEEKDNGVNVLKIAAGKSGTCIASWRRGVLLTRGKYRFRAVIRAKGVVALASEQSAPGVGAGLRLADGMRENALTGSGDFKTVEYEFEVMEEAADVELVVELRAASGLIVIKAESLTLTKLGS